MNFTVTKLFINDIAVIAVYELIRYLHKKYEENHRSYFSVICEDCGEEYCKVQCSNLGEYDEYGKETALRTMEDMAKRIEMHEPCAKCGGKLKTTFIQKGKF